MVNPKINLRLQNPTLADFRKMADKAGEGQGSAEFRLKTRDGSSRELKLKLKGKFHNKNFAVLPGKKEARNAAKDSLYQALAHEYGDQLKIINDEFATHFLNDPTVTVDKFNAILAKLELANDTSEDWIEVENEIFEPGAQPTTVMTRNLPNRAVNAEDFGPDLDAPIWKDSTFNPAYGLWVPDEVSPSGPKLTATQSDRVLELADGVMSQRDFYQQAEHKHLGHYKKLTGQTRMARLRRQTDKEFKSIDEKLFQYDAIRRDGSARAACARHAILIDMATTIDDWFDKHDNDDEVTRRIGGALSELQQQCQSELAELEPMLTEAGLVRDITDEVERPEGYERATGRTVFEYATMTADGVSVPAFINTATLLAVKVICTKKLMDGSLEGEWASEIDVDGLSFHEVFGEVGENATELFEVADGIGDITGGTLSVLSVAENVARGVLAHRKKKHVDHMAHAAAPTANWVARSEASVQDLAQKTNQLMLLVDYYQQNHPDLLTTDANGKFDVFSHERERLPPDLRVAVEEVAGLISPEKAALLSGAVNYQLAGLLNDLSQSAGGDESRRARRATLAALVVACTIATAATGGAAAPLAVIGTAAAAAKTGDSAWFSWRHKLSNMWNDKGDIQRDAIADFFMDGLVGEGSPDPDTVRVLQSFGILSSEDGELASELERIGELFPFYQATKEAILDQIVGNDLHHLKKLIVPERGDESATSG